MKIVVDRAEYTAGSGEIRNGYGSFVGKLCRKHQLERPRS
jgi:hypothetical protein